MQGSYRGTFFIGADPAVAIISFYPLRSPRFKASWTTRTSAFVLHAHAYHVLGVLAAVFIISYLSYRYIESPFLWRKPPT